MKTAKVCIALISLLALSESNAQEFYIRGGAGFIVESGKTEFNNADPNGLTNIQQSTDITVNPDGTAHIKSLNGTLGGGFKVNATGGYMFNNFIGAELGFNYFWGNEKTIGKFTSPALQSKETAQVEGLDVMPAVYLTPNFAGLNPYARIGAIMTVAGKLDIDTSVYQVDGGGEGTDISVVARSEVESKFSVGFAGALGVTYPIGARTHVFGEVEFKNFSIKSKSAEIVEYTTLAITDGQAVLVPGQQLADLPVYEKKFIFEDNYTENLGTPPNENEPRRIPTQYVNMGGVGINIGIRYSFGK